MKSKVFFFILTFLFHLGIFSAPRESVIMGKIVGGGLYLETKTGDIYPIRSNELSREIMDISGQQVRILCKLEDDNCSPIRYEIAPFINTSGLAKWTLKPIPKYVYGNNTAFNPIVNADGNLLYWTVLTEKESGTMQRIWYSETDEHGLWKKGIEMSNPLNNKSPSAVISALPGGNELFVFGSFIENDLYADLKEDYERQKQELVRNTKTVTELKVKYAILKEEYQKNYEKIQNRVPLYKSSKQGSGWTIPQQINFPDFYNLYKSEDNPLHQVFGGSTLSSNGKALIYSAKHRDALGKLDLYLTIQDSNGIFKIGKNLGRTINTTQEEMAPFLASDDKTLYFSSNGHNGLSIYMSQRLDDSWEKWTEPKEISSNLKGVNYFSIPAAGNWAYLSKAGNLYMAYLPNEIKPDPVILVKGRVINEKGEPLKADILYESLSTMLEKGTTVSDELNGKFSIVLPYGEKYGFFAKKEGYLPVHKNLDFRKDEKKYQEIEVEIVLPKIEKGKEITINNLFFDSGKHDIRKESELELDRLAKTMKENPTLKVQIEGHTDGTGDPNDNMALSLERANAVANYLKKYGIDLSRMKPVGFGATKHVTGNDTPENRQKNRRVMFKVLEN